MNHLWEWLFDGVGGAAGLAFIGFAYHRFRSNKRDETPQSTVSEVVDVSADDGSSAVSNRSSGHSSPVVSGSYNTFNISHIAQSVKAREGAEVLRDDEEKEQAKFPWGDALAVFIGIPAFFCFVGGLIWLALHLGTVRGVLQGNRAAATIAYQYGKGITPKEFSRTGDQDTSCSDPGIICFGEDSIPSRAIPIPEEHGGNWSRIAVLVDYQESGDSSRVLISTKSKDISLNYADHRDGSTYKQIEFQMDDVKALSESQRSYWFPVDVMYRETGVSFPITVTVEEDRRRPHSATAVFEIARKEPMPPKGPKLAKASRTSNAATGTRQITIAERVTTIIAGLLNVSRNQVKPESDLEIDLGATPTDVSLILDELEEEYGLSIPKADALKIRTVKEAINYIEVKAGHE